MRKMRGGGSERFWLHLRGRIAAVGEKNQRGQGGVIVRAGVLSEELAVVAVHDRRVIVRGKKGGS